MQRITFDERVWKRHCINRALQAQYRAEFLGNRARKVVAPNVKTTVKIETQAWPTARQTAQRKSTVRQGSEGRAIEARGNGSCELVVRQIHGPTRPQRHAVKPNSLFNH
jgi:hypothetical protein